MSNIAVLRADAKAAMARYGDAMDRAGRAENALMKALDGREDEAEATGKLYPEPLPRDNPVLTEAIRARAELDAARQAHNEAADALREYRENAAVYADGRVGFDGD